jgi:glyoxylase-like metal-dependent hydrolase (beta-lactamase superfamily II)
MQKEKQMKQEIITIPLKVPCYLVKTTAGFFLIDSGDASDRSRLSQELDQAGVTPGNLNLIILTHGDFDHSGNAAYLKEKYAVKIAMHSGDVEMVKRGDQGWNRKTEPDRVTLFGRLIMLISSYIARPGQFDTFTPDLMLDVGADLSGYGFEAKVLHLPGHSKGSIGILTINGDLFCGDLLMNMFKPDLHFMVDDLSDFDRSIEKLKQLNIQTIYPGHGSPFLMEHFLKNYS